MYLFLFLFANSPMHDDPEYSKELVLPALSKKDMASGYLKDEAWKGFG